MSAQTAVISVADIQQKFGKSEKGPWTLVTITDEDGVKYKTFDEKLLALAQEAMRGAFRAAVTFTATEKTFKNQKGDTVPYTERTMTGIEVQRSSTMPAPAAHAERNNPNHLPIGYWEEKERLDFLRTSSSAALKACAEVMAACISAQVESYRFEDAIKIVKQQSKELRASYFADLEKGVSNGSTSTADEGPQAEVVE